MEENTLHKYADYICGTIMLANLTTDCELDHIIGFSRELRSQFFNIIAQCVEYKYGFLRPDFFNISERNELTQEELDEFFEFIDGNGFIPMTYGGATFDVERAKAIIEKLKSMRGDTNDS